MENKENRKSKTPLDKLAARIQKRSDNGDVSNSYTASLVASGPGKCAKKFGEEAVEAAIACVEGHDQELILESADVLYHLLVMLEIRGLGIEDVYAELERRMKMSGLEEKASRRGGQ